MEAILNKIFHALVIIPTEEEKQFVIDRLNGGKTDNTERADIICAYLQEEGKEKLVYDILESNAMEAQKIFDYKKLRKKLHEVKVVSSKPPVSGSDFFSIADLMREYYDSEHHKMYNSWKFTHLKEGYDTFNSMEDYFKKLNMVAIEKIN